MTKYCLFFVLLLSSCYHDAMIEVVNKSDREINILWNRDTIPVYPTENDVSFYLSNTVPVNTSYKIWEHGPYGWIKLISESKNGKANFFILDADSVRSNNSIDDLVLKKMYKRIEFSEAELERNGWKIVIK